MVRASLSLHLGKLDDILVVFFLPLLFRRVPVVFAQATQPVGDVELWGLLKVGYLCPGFVGRKRRVLKAVERGDRIPLREK